MLILVSVKIGGKLQKNRRDRAMNKLVKGDPQDKLAALRNDVKAAISLLAQGKPWLAEERLREAVEEGE